MVDGSRLTYNAVVAGGTGTATVTVTASDGKDDGTASMSFTVTVSNSRPESSRPGNQPEEPEPEQPEEEEPEEEEMEPEQESEEPEEDESSFLEDLVENTVDYAAEEAAERITEEVLERASEQVSKQVLKTVLGCGPCGSRCGSGHDRLRHLHHLSRPHLLGLRLQQRGTVQTSGGVPLHPPRGAGKRIPRLGAGPLRSGVRRPPQTLPPRFPGRGMPFSANGHLLG